MEITGNYINFNLKWARSPPVEAGGMFTTDEHIYPSEKSGAKSNTVRFLNYGEIQELERLLIKCKLKYPKIRIHTYSVNDRQESVHKKFERQITDIRKTNSLLGQTLVIFSWRHQTI